MNRQRVVIGLCALVAIGIVGGGAVSAARADEPPNHANRFEATFVETNVSVTNRIADLGVFQLINTGTGTVEGFGAATLVLDVTQDRTVQPCGPGSWTNAGIERISVEAGVLILRAVAYVCQTASGPVATERWWVDGASSTGVFANARGSGEGTVLIATSTHTLSGKLNLVG